MNSPTYNPATRLLALLATVAMLATLLVVNAVPAFAAVASNARLLAGNEVLPGDFTYTVQLEPGGDANVAVITLPVGIGVSIPSAAAVSVDTGLTNVTLQQVGSIQRLILSGEPTSDTMVVSIDADIATPTSVTETAGSFDVAMSNDSGRTFETAEEGDSDGRGSLDTVIRFLEIIEVVTVAPTPLGAQDGSGTEGQDIDVRATVRNYLGFPVSVDLSLASRGRGAAFDGVPADTDTISGAQSVTVGGNSTASATFDVKLGGAVNESGNAADRPTRFSASATEQITSAPSISSSVLDYEVQIQGRLAVTGATFDPRAVSPGPRTFTMEAAHSGTPAFTIDGGSISFAQTTATIDGTPTFAAGESQSLSMTGQVAGDDGDYEVQFLYQATDENGYAFLDAFGTINEPSGSILGGQVPVIVTIDALAPVLTLDIDLPNDAEGQQQTRAKNGDVIVVDGTIDDLDAAQACPEDDPTALNCVRPIALVANGVTIAEAAADFNNPFEPGEFTVTFEDVQFPLSAGTFTALGSATDVAGNLGQVIADLEIYDNIVPTLISARTESTAGDDPAGMIAALTGDAAVISVRFSENGLIIGGCSPSEWTVDGQQVVKEVRYTDNSDCQDGVTGPDNERLLILSSSYDRDATPAVRYTPSDIAPSVKDGAGNFALENTVTAVVGIVPALPDLVTVYRATGSNAADACMESDTGCETAYFDEDEGSYYTRFDGNDAVVCVAGGRAGYQVEATDGQGNAFALTRQGVTGSPTCLRVPIGSADQAYQRGIRFLNSAGEGPEVLFTLVLDTVVPVISSVTDRVDGSDVLTVTFNDKVVEGEDFAIDWLVYERLSGGDLVFYSPDAVAVPQDADDNLLYDRRTLTVDFRDYGSFAGVGFEFQSGMFGGDRYKDRAGNPLADNPNPVAPSAQ